MVSIVAELPEYASGRIAVDPAGNVFVAAYRQVLRVDAQTGAVTVVAGVPYWTANLGDGGPATEAGFDEVSDIALDAEGNLFIADKWHHRFRRVDAATGIITTIAGNGIRADTGDGGPAVDASVREPEAITVDASGNVYVSGGGTPGVIRKIDTSGTITRFAGGYYPIRGGDGGPVEGAAVDHPAGVAVDGSGNIYFSEPGTHRVRKVAASTGIITTVAGNGTAGFSGDNGPGALAQLNEPMGVAVDAVGNLYIADAGNRRVRRVDAVTGIITTVAELAKPVSVAVDRDGVLYIADRPSHLPRGCIVKVDSSGIISVNNLAFSQYLALDNKGNVYGSEGNAVWKWDPRTNAQAIVAGGMPSGFSGDGVQR